MTARLLRRALALGLLLGATGCQAVSADPLRSAVLAQDGPEARAAITKVLLAATREGRVSFGQSDLAKDPLIVVQPPRPSPYEGNSPAMPVYFDLVTDGKACFLREQKTGKTHPLPGVTCRPK